MNGRDGGRSFKQQLNLPHLSGFNSFSLVLILNGIVVFRRAVCHVDVTGHFTYPFSTKTVPELLQSHCLILNQVNVF